MNERDKRVTDFLQKFNKEFWDLAETLSYNDYVKLVDGMDRIMVIAKGAIVEDD